MSSIRYLSFSRRLGVTDPLYVPIQGCPETSVRVVVSHVLEQSRHKNKSLRNKLYMIINIIYMITIVSIGHRGLVSDELRRDSVYKREFRVVTEGRNPCVV